MAVSGRFVVLRRGIDVQVLQRFQSDQDNQRSRAEGRRQNDLANAATGPDGAGNPNAGAGRQTFHVGL